MSIELRIDAAAMEPVIEAAVRRTIERVRAEQAAMGQRISFSIKEAATLTGLSIGTLREARAQGRIKGSIVGRKLVFSRGELERLIREAE
jgi:excisionase family DNA binding protein